MSYNLNEINIPSSFNKEVYEKFINSLMGLCDQEYLKFNKKITFTKYKMIGVRVPVLREIAKKIAKGDFLSYLDCSDRRYFEEILLEGFVIGFIKDYEIFLKYFMKFLPYVDNWAVCDMCISSFKIIGKRAELFKNEIFTLVSSKNQFYVRVGIISLMDYYISEDNLSMIFNTLDNIKIDGYYIEMAMAWLISVCFIKYPISTEEYLKNNKLSDSVINKGIQKIRDSRRVTKRDKDRLLCYKR